MINITQSKEILISTKNQMGLLLEISDILTSEGFNINAISAHAAGNFALVGIITDNNQRALKLLGDQGYSVVENNVLLVDLNHKVGVLKRITKELKANNIDIINIYGAGVTENERGTLVFSTTDNYKAFSLLRRPESRVGEGTLG